MVVALELKSYYEQRVFEVAAVVQSIDFGCVAAEIETVKRIDFVAIEAPAT